MSSRASAARYSRALFDVALKEAARETIAFLKSERQLSAEDAYSLASIAVNYTVGEAVDDLQNLPLVRHGHDATLDRMWQMRRNVTA